MFRGVFSVPSRCGKPLFLQFSDIVKKDASDNDGSTCHGERRQDFSVEDSHQDRVQDRFHGIDDGSSDRICIPRTDGKQDVGQSDLHTSKDKDRGKNRRSENRFPQDHGGKTDAAQKLADHHGGQGISFFKLVEHEHACIEKAGKKCDEISRDPSRGQTVEKEAKDADQNKRNCDDLQPGRLFSEKQKNIRRISQIGILYCRTMAFPAVVSLLAIANIVVTPAIHTAPMKTVKLNFMRWRVKNM